MVISMNIRDVLNKDVLTEEDKKFIVNYICEEEKKYEDINFNIIRYPEEKKKFKLFRKKEDVVTLGFQKTILGFMENRYEVAFNHSKIDESSLVLPTLLTTIYHELCHVKQKTKTTSLRYPLVATSIFSKELLVTGKHKSYYKSNYESIYGECDARIVAREKTLHLLGRYNKPLYDKVVDEFKAKNKVDNALRRLYIHRNGNDVDLGEISISKKVDKILSSNPEYIDSATCLIFEYDNKGRRKDLKTLYEMEEYYTRDKNPALKMMINDAISEFMFIYLMINKEESLMEFYNKCGNEGLKRLEKALRYKHKNIVSRKAYNKKLLDAKILDNKDYVENYYVLKGYEDLIKTYLKLITKLYISRQSKVK